MSSGRCEICGADKNQPCLSTLTGADLTKRHETALYLLQGNEPNDADFYQQLAKMANEERQQSEQARKWA